MEQRKAEELAQDHTAVHQQPRKSGLNTAVPKYAEKVI